MKARLGWLLGLLLLGGAACGAPGAESPQARSLSHSRQFTVYGADATVRTQVTSLADELRSSAMELLGDTSRWKFPIFLFLKRVTASSQAPAVGFQFLEIPDGAAIQIEMRIGDKPAEVQFQKQILRAVFLEYSYRQRPPIRGGERFAEAPWWLIEGALGLFNQRRFGMETGVYQGVVEANRIPEIGEFLLTDDSRLGSAAQAVDASFAMCLVQLLGEQPNGRLNLARLLRHWPDVSADPIAALAQDFPGLGTSPNALQKWWTLSLARLAARERYKALSSEATEAELRALLQFQLVINKKGEKKSFSIEQFEEFVKLPSARAAMVEAQGAAVTLSVRANAVFRPVVADYEAIFAALARGKTRGMAVRISEAAKYRTAMLARMSAIDDYLNWYEATQLGTRSNAFEGFFKSANDLVLEEDQLRRNGPVARYLDQLQEEF